MNGPKPIYTDKPVPTVDDVIQDADLGALAPQAEFFEGGRQSRGP